MGAVIRPAGPVPPTAAVLTSVCRGRLAGYKVPAHWLFTDSLPLTPTGKIRKDALSAQLADSAALTPQPSPRKPGTAQLKKGTRT